MSWIEDNGPAEDMAEERGYQDPRVGHGHRYDRPIADVLEQEVPVDGGEEDPVGRDDERVEPIGPADWYETAPVEPDPLETWGRRSA